MLIYFKSFNVVTFDSKVTNTNKFNSRRHIYCEANFAEELTEYMTMDILNCHPYLSKEKQTTLHDHFNSSKKSNSSGIDSYYETAYCRVHMNTAVNTFQRSVRLYRIKVSPL